ncbi:MAG: hypothetical protein KDF54_10720, partial [Hydrogenophaga sp.]|nr:hypothetical protein [Hydrogenophaga sp.]
MFRTLRPIVLSTLATAALLSALPARAIGRVADVRLIDRDSGETLTVHRHRGEYWVAGRPGARYAISVRSLQPGRLLGVVSVDGVNVVSGETASWDQTGYVLNAWQRHDITGWRKSDHEVAAFHFTALPDAYAARTGRPANVGVIGVAVFREQEAQALVTPSFPAWRERRELSEAERDKLARSAAPAAEAMAQAGNQADFGRSADVAVPEAIWPARPASPKLGTGHGGREFSQVGHTEFERRSARPDEVIRIRYDSRENLVAMGVLPPPWR